MMMLKPILAISLIVVGLSAGISPFSVMISDTVQITVKICDSIITKPIVLAMFGFDVPYTVSNFLTICKGTSQYNGTILTYKNSKFHRIIPEFMIQGGDITRGDGTGGISIYGENFKDENFSIDHDIGVISMANAGPNTNSSQFFITTAQTSFLNGKHVVFGMVTSGMDIVYMIERQGSESGTPKCPVTIEQCSIVN